jgi:ribokinase
MIVVCGALHLDVVVRAPHLPRLDETVTGQDVSYVFGGKGGNQAVAASRMGAEVAMIGCVGSDAFGARLLQGLADAGVDATQVQRDPGPSGMSVAIVGPDGGYGAVIISASNLRLDADAIRFPEETRYLLLQNEIPEIINLRLAAMAREKGAGVVLNAAPARPMSPELLAMVDLLVVNRVEAEDITGLRQPPEGAARSLGRLGPPSVIVTLGADGAALWDGTTYTAPAFPATVVSTHGAGDAFLGAMVAELSRGADLRAALAFGQAAGALHVSSPLQDRGAIRPANVHKLLGRP